MMLWRKKLEPRIRRGLSAVSSRYTCGEFDVRRYRSGKGMCFVGEMSHLSLLRKEKKKKEGKEETCENYLSVC